MPERTVLAEHDARPGITVQLTANCWDAPVDATYVASDRALLDLCLTARPSYVQGRYEGRWKPGRFGALGDLIFLPEHIPMHYRVGHGSQCSLQLRFAPGMLGVDGGWTQAQLHDGLSLRLRPVHSGCLRILREIDRPGFASEVIIEATSRIIAIELARHFGSCAKRAGALPRGGLSPWRKRRIDERLQLSGPPPTLSELAQLCGISCRHLARTFRQETGRSIFDHIACRRVELAKTLLTDSCAPIRQIAADLGFAQPSSFSTAFRAATGVSPREYRQRAARHRSARSGTNFPDL